MGTSRRKDLATKIAYLDTASYLTDMDPSLWQSWEDKKREKKVEKGVVAASVEFVVRDEEIEVNVAEAVGEAFESELVKKGKEMRKREEDRAKREKEKWLAMRRGVNLDQEAQTNDEKSKLDGMTQLERERFEAGKKVVEGKKRDYLNQKSQEMRFKLQTYQTDDKVAKLRQQRASLPVTSHASSVLSKIAVSSVVVVLAATGSGKTTQIPQLILDDAISEGKGAECNIVCTQPRRIAAISVAERVAKERGQVLGDQVGYQVRFESKLPKKDGSIMFCTTGLFLRRLQSDLDKTASGGGKEGESFLDGVTHVAVDEVHERDVDTDLLLFVLRRLLHERRKMGKKEIKVVLM
jgi:HrpA-like RNA helicase